MKLPVGFCEFDRGYARVLFINRWRQGVDRLMLYGAVVIDLRDGGREEFGVLGGASLCVLHFVGAPNLDATLSRSTGDRIILANLSGRELQPSARRKRSVAKQWFGSPGQH